MKKFTNQSYVSHAGRMNNGGGKFRRIALFPLMLLMLLLLPTRMVAQTANGNTSNQAYAEFDNSSGTFTFKCGPKPAGAYDLNEGEKLPKWFAQKDKIKTVVFDASFANARPTSCYYWFCFCYNLTTIEGIEYLNTEKVTNMKDMFYRCSALTSLDLSNFNTENVTDMKEMFCSCSALTTIFVSDKFVTGQVTSSVDMFSGCDKLIGAIKYDGKNTNNKDYANYETGYFAPEGGFPDYAVFDKGTGTLTFKCGPKPTGAYDLNEGEKLPGWYAQRDKIKTVVFDASFANARLTNCYAWFYGCNNLTTIEGIEYLNTENVTNMDGMFYNCRALTSLNLTSFNTAKVESMSGMFYNCCALTSLDLSNFNTANVTDMSQMFEGCSALTSLNLSNFNTAGVKEMYCMFYNCCALTSLDLSNFNTANVTDMSKMFEGCSALTSLNLSNFNTAGVKDMYCMFCVCSALTSLDLSNFNTANVTDMSQMFEGCSALTTIFVSDKFVTDHVTNSSNMFSGCDKLIGAIKYDGKNTNNKDYANYETGYFALEGRFPGYAVFDGGTGTLTFRSGPSTSKPEGAYDLNVGTSLPGWFAQRENIKTVVFDASFANARLTNCYAWFCYCTNLTKIEGIENLNTEKVTNMSGMFSDCSDLTSLDLSNFNTAKVENMSYMFGSCFSLTGIYASDKFVTDQVTSSVDMFSGCDKLIGAIKYDGKNTNNKDYANYKTGYFSKLVGKNGDEKIGAAGETLTTDNLVLADDKDFVAYETFKAKNASYSRPMNEGTIWGTLCLPFEVSLDNQNFRAFKLLSADEGTGTVELEELNTSIAAGTPVIIKMNEGATQLDFSETNKEIAKDVQTAETADGNYQLQGLYTQKMFSKDADNNCYIVKGNQLMNPAKLLENTTVTKVASKPFRAYMVDNSSAAAGAKMFSIGFNDNTTAIDNLNTIANDKAIYYDIQGIRLNAPQKGINIVKRGNKTMKVIIK